MDVACIEVCRCVATGESESAADPSGHRDGLSRDVGRLVGAQEGNHPPDLLRLSDSGGQCDIWSPCVYCTSHTSETLGHVAYLLMLSWLLNSSMTSSFPHNWNNTAYYRDFNMHRESN